MTHKKSPSPKTPGNKRRSKKQRHCYDPIEPHPRRYIPAFFTKRCSMIAHIDAFDIRKDRSCHEENDNNKTRQDFLYRHTYREVIFRGYPITWPFTKSLTK